MKMATGEDALREQIAVCTRMLVMADIMDYSGHVSARIPDTDRVLIQPRDSSRASLDAEDILVVDLDGKILDGEGPAPAETALHVQIYRARPDVAAVCHGHPPMSTLFTMVDRPYVAVRNFAYRFRGMPIHPDPTHIRSAEQGAAVAATLGNGRACLLRGHGTAIASGSIEELFMDCLEMEENARGVIQASALGALRPIDDEEAAALKVSYGLQDTRSSKIWMHYVEKAKLAGVV
jgi:ribulose-5-phosphate 4-epimerase/fuculose-1-phosphate aldolase